MDCSQVCKECFVNEAGPSCAIRSNLRIEYNLAANKEKSYRTEVHFLEGQHKDKVVVVSKQFESNECTVSRDFESCASCELRNSTTVDDETCMILDCKNLQGEGLYNECTGEFDGTGGAIVYAAFGRPALRAPDLPSQHQAINRQDVCSAGTFFPAPTMTMSPTAAPTSLKSVDESSSSDSNSELAALSVLALIPLAAIGYWLWNRQNYGGEKKRQKEDPPDLAPPRSAFGSQPPLNESASVDAIASAMAPPTRRVSAPANYMPGNKDQCQTVVTPLEAQPQHVPVYLPEHKDQCRNVVLPGQMPMVEAVMMADEPSKSASEYSV